MKRIAVFFSNLHSTFLKKKGSIARGIVRHLPPGVTPNQLSLLRIILFLPVIFFLQKNEYRLACGVFLVAASLDFFDGALAEERNMETDLGKALDPLADRVLNGGTFLLIAFQYPEHFFPYLFWSLITIESILCVFYIVGKSLENRFSGLKGEVKANLFGKWKTTFYVFGLSIFLWFGPSALAKKILWIGVSFGGMSLFGHLKTFFFSRKKRP